MRENNLDLLRIVLALAVIFSHSNPLLFGPGTPEPLSHALPGTDLGKIAVGGFFAISGVLIAASWERSKGLFDFLLRRVRRIYPGFIVAYLATILVAATLAPQGLGAFLSNLAWLREIRSAVTLLRPGFGDVPPGLPFTSSLNGSLWTIRPEFGCYLLIAALGLTRVLGRRWVPPLLFAVLLAFTLARHMRGPAGLIEDYVRLATFFLAGTTAWVWRDRIPRTPLLGGIAASSLGLCWLHPLAALVVLPISGVYLLFLLAYSDRRYLPSLGRFGDPSYGIYLYGWLLQQWLIAKFGASTFSSIGLSLATVPLAILAGYASYHAVERWFLSTRRRGAAHGT